MNRAVVGLLAHVDAGKTTLAEALMYATGAIRAQGRVDHGDAQLDFHDIERDRGITIFAKHARIEWEGTQIVLMDAPGHVDFSAEAERILQVLDLAILVVGANDGVMAHTKTLWRLLKRYDVPTLVFVNKMDLHAPDPTQIMEQLQKHLSPACFMDAQRADATIQEQLALADEDALEEYLGQGLLSMSTIGGLVRSRKAFPCVCGSALKGEGVSELLSSLVEYAPRRQWKKDSAARVYKVSHEEQGARVTWLKVTGGTLRAKALVSGRSASGEPWQQKIDQVRRYAGSKYEVVREVEAGDVCAVVGLTHTLPGTGIGAEKNGPAPVVSPVLTYKVIPHECDVHAVHEALTSLADEDPQLGVTYDEGLREVQVQLMGVVQQEVVLRILQERYGLAVSFGPGSVMYMETIEAPVEGIGHFEPLRHYAEVHLRLEPGERGSGIVACSECPEDDLAKNWQRLILMHVGERTHKGVQVGAPLTDVLVVLTAGRAHAKHTEGGDFRQATYRAIRQGLMHAQSILLEPYYAYVLEVPRTNVGRALSDLQMMSARFEPPVIVGDTAQLVGRSPVSTMRDYALKVATYTSGQGSLALEYGGYEPCHNAQEVIDASSYDPEADLAHTPDSVFCSHGAGYTVKWYDVAEHAHVK